MKIMGSLIDKIREDEEEYYWICKELGISRKNEGNMYDHYPKIFKQFGVKDKWELKEIINKIKTREIKIEQLLKDNEI